MRSRPRQKHRSGFVSLIGRPNTGKSTLLNALAGRKLAIVTDKPQTTRTTIQAVWTTPGAQVVFVDTPGVHESATLFNRRMMQTIAEALQERDLLLFLSDCTRPFQGEDEAALALVKRTGCPVFAVINKIDLLPAKPALLPLLAQLEQLHPFDELIPVSALTGEGIEDLRQAILKRMPAGPAYFPDDFITDQPERFLAAEIVREKILHLTRAEVPHAVAVLVDKWEEEGRLIRIAATIFVERPGQKTIVLGEKGARLKQAGTEARLELEGLLGRRVYLSLFVKVKPGWRENEAFLKELDWRAMLGADAPPDFARAEAPSTPAPEPEQNGKSLED